jgi:NarL family two-component system response regulator LiaR
MKAAARIVIADDHAMLRKGLAAYLSIHDDLQIVAEATNGREVIDLVSSVNPDVVLMDIRMPVVDGIEATRFIRQRQPEIQVIVLTSSHSPDLVQAALAAGATGYLLKDISADELAAAIRLVRSGHTVLAPGTAPMLQAGPSSSPTADPLTDREQEILALMAAGLSNADMARRLSLSLSTVKFHVSNVIAKLEVNSRTEAVAVATQRNLIPPPTPLP